MLSNRKKQYTKLSEISHFAINLAQHDVSTYSIQIANLRDGSILADLPIDPMDNTLAATLSADAITKLGNAAEDVLAELSKVLQEQIGAKEFIMRPVNAELPGFVPAKEHGFKRTRHASRIGVLEDTALILKHQQELVAELDEQYDFVVGIENLAKLIHKPYQKVFGLLEGHANFTEDKMEEYKSEDIQGVKSRLHNANVTVVAMLDKQRNLCGILRCLAMGNQVGYLSDETLKQDILPLGRFLGGSEEEQAQNRAIFLLAYFANKALPLVEQQDQFVIIAAAGREAVYEVMGFQPFPMNSKDYVLTVKLGPPGELLKQLKDQLMKAPSGVVAAGKFAAAPESDEQRAEVVEKSQLGFGLN